MIDKTGNTYTPICDGCGEELDIEFDFIDAVYAMKTAGWRQVRPTRADMDWYHLCPACAAASDFG